MGIRITVKDLQGEMIVSTKSFLCFSQLLILHRSTRYHGKRRDNPNKDTYYGKGDNYVRRRDDEHTEYPPRKIKVEESEDEGRIEKYEQERKIKVEEDEDMNLYG